MLVDQVDYTMALGLVMNCKWEWLIFHGFGRLVRIRDDALQIRVKSNNSLLHACSIQVQFQMSNTSHCRMLFPLTKTSHFVTKGSQKIKLHFLHHLTHNWPSINCWLFGQTVDQSQLTILDPTYFISLWALRVQASAPCQSVVQYHTTSLTWKNIPNQIHNKSYSPHATK